MTIGQIILWAIVVLVLGYGASLYGRWLWARIRGPKADD